MAIATGTALALAAAAAAAGVSAHNTNQTNKRSDRAAADAIRNQREIQDETNAKVNKTLQDVQASSPTEERKSAEGQYLAQVRNAQQLARANLEGRGLSDEYDTGAAAAGDQAQNYAQTVAGLMSRIDAPVNQRIGEGFSFGNLSTDIGQTQAKSAGQAWIDKLKAATIRRDPWLDAAAAGLSGYSGAAGGGGSAAAPAAASRYRIGTGPA